MKHRFYLENQDFWDTLTIHDKEIVHQCNKVLRLKNEDFVRVFNGIQNCDYVYQIRWLRKDLIDLQLIDSQEKSVIQNDIYIYQAFPNKLSKYEYLIQKCSEVWVKKICFFRSKFTQKTPFLTENKKERLQKIAKEAAEQSGRNTVVKLEFIDTIPLYNISQENSYFFHTQKDNCLKLRDIIQDNQSAFHLIIWPEWWFEKSEIDDFQEAQIQWVHLGQYVLRTETVWAVVAFFILQSFT